LVARVGWNEIGRHLSESWDQVDDAIDYLDRKSVAVPNVEGQQLVWVARRADRVGSDHQTVDSTRRPLFDRHRVDQ
jgi:hypothetical protein